MTLAELDEVAIVLLMSGAWILVALAEWTAAQAAGRRADVFEAPLSGAVSRGRPVVVRAARERAAGLDVVEEEQESPTRLPPPGGVGGALRASRRRDPRLRRSPCRRSRRREQPRTMLDLGDSLSVGTDPYLRAQLRGYRIERLYDVGLHAAEAAAIVARVGAALPSVLVVSAGTNDDPRMVSAFARSISAVLRSAGPARCVVWSTISRPPAVGRELRRAQPRTDARAATRHENLVLVDWARMVRRHPGWLSDDGVHVSAAGYKARAAAIATAVTTRCS